jgi:tRNA (guanine37-N1)-methyltransferase
MLETCVRLLPGVLGNDDSSREESFSDSLDGMLEYPQYTRPVEFRGLGVPDVLKSGHHQHVRAWRRSQTERRTAERRPELVGKRGSQ